MTGAPLTRGCEPPVDLHVVASHTRGGEALLEALADHRAIQLFQAIHRLHRLIRVVDQQFLRHAVALGPRRRVRLGLLQVRPSSDIPLWPLGLASGPMPSESDGDDREPTSWEIKIRPAATNRTSKSSPGSRVHPPRSRNSAKIGKVRLAVAIREVNSKAAERGTSVRSRKDWVILAMRGRRPSSRLTAGCPVDSTPHTSLRSRHSCDALAREWQT